MRRHIVVDVSIYGECGTLSVFGREPVFAHARLRFTPEDGGTHLKYNIFKQLPVLPPTLYTAADLSFIVPRVLELTYTSHSMAPFARDLGYDGPPFAWNEDRRAQLRAELDAWYARAYGLTRDELRYILDPADVKGAGLSLRDLPRAQEERDRALRRVPHRSARACRLGSIGTRRSLASCRMTSRSKDPPGFVVRTEAQKAAWDNGYRLERGIADGWLHYASTTAPGSIWIAGCSGHGPWLLSVGHSGVAAEIGTSPASPPLPALASRPSCSPRSRSCMPRWIASTSWR